MLDKKIDKRIIHTKFFLKSALLELMKTKKIEQITTTELCKTANINRNTFYVHYSTPEDLLNEIENELLQEIEELLNTNSDQEKLNLLYTHFKDKKELYKIFINNKSSNISDNMLFLCKKHNIYQWQHFDNPDKELSELFFLFVSTGCAKIINEWILNDCTIPIEKLQKILDSFSIYGLSAFKKIE